jgi:outer membrane protein TolC
VLPQVTLTFDQLNETAIKGRPQVKSLASLADKGLASHRLAQKEFYPDFNLAFEYMFREASMNDPGYNMFSLGVTFNLPFQQEKRHAMLAESTSETSMAVEELNGLKNSISLVINDTLAQMERRRSLIELYKRGIIPQAEQSLESAVISYRVNKVDFLTLLDGRLSLFNYERELYESQAEYMMKLAQLEAAVGVDLLEIKK